MSTSKSYVFAVLLLTSLAASAQDSWLQPAVITGTLYALAPAGVDAPPVVGAEVRLRLLAGDLLREDRGREAFGPPLAVARTNAKGEYALPLPLWSTMVAVPFVVIAEAGGLVDATAVLPFDRRTHRCDLQLRGRLAVRHSPAIVDPDGRPYVGLRVVPLIRVSPPHDVPLEKARGIAYPNDGGDYVAAAVTTTDAAGRYGSYTNSGLILTDEGMFPFRAKAGRVTIARGLRGAASRPVSESFWPELSEVAGFREALRPPSESALALQVSARHSQRGVVAGRVVDEHGTPIVGAEVVVETPEAPLTPEASLLIADYRPMSPFACTDADGRFRIEHLPTGRFRLRAAVRGRAPAYGPAFDVDVGSAVSAGVLVLRPGARLRVIGALGYLCFRDGLIEFEGYGEFHGIGLGPLSVGTWTGGCVRHSGPGPILVSTEDDVTVDFRW